MEVYKFDKCLLDRFSDCSAVLSWTDQVITSAKVRGSWSYWIELQIEPTGWQALWKIPRVICEELNIRYPCVVYGYVENVLFKDLKAVFKVEAVQDEEVHLPERHEALLVDLYPTLEQGNTELNVERTADCLDQLRFFYNSVWMPWDEETDDDLNWVEKHLESRIRFCYDLRKGGMKRALAAHIKQLITEAKYIQQRRDYILLGHSDEEVERLDESFNKTEITDLMRWHLRIAVIKNEIEMLENPNLRLIYEETKFDDEKSLKNSIASNEHMTYIVTMPETLEKQMNWLRLAQQRVPKDGFVKLYTSLEEVMKVCNASDKIYLSPGRHAVKFLEYLNDNGGISGLVDDINKKSYDPTGISTKNDAIIMSSDYDSILLVFDGNFTLENLVLDCEKIRTGILIKNGKVLLRNCRIIGNNGKSSTQEGINLRNGELELENCIIEKFATGITTKKGTRLTLRETCIQNCKIGLDLDPKTGKFNIEKSSISNANKCGVYIENITLQTEMKTFVTEKLEELNDFILPQLKFWTDGEVLEYKNCKKNIYAINRLNSLIDEQTLMDIADDDDDEKP